MQCRVDAQTSINAPPPAQPHVRLIEHPASTQMFGPHPARPRLRATAWRLTIMAPAFQVKPGKFGRADEEGRVIAQKAEGEAMRRAQAQDP